MGLDPTRDNYNNTLTAAAVGGGGGGVSGSMDVDGRVSKGRSIRRQKKSEGGGEEEGEESDAAEAEAAAAQGMQLAGNGGDGAFEGAVVSLVAALQGGPAAPGFMGAMLEGIAALAAAVGLLRKPVAAAAEGETGEQEVEQHHFLFTGGLVVGWLVRVLCVWWGEVLPPALPILLFCWSEQRADPRRRSFLNYNYTSSRQPLKKNH